MNIEDLPIKYQKQVKEKLGLSAGEGSKGNNKYGAFKVDYDGIIFDSRKEGARYLYLKELQMLGEVTDLTLQPVFTLQEGFTHNGKKERPITYIADFMYNDREGHTIVEDVKSPATRTPQYKIKRKLFLYKYGDRYDFREIGG